MFLNGHGQGFRQEPERNGRHEGDSASDEVAQPPRPHPAGIAWTDSHSFCIEIRTQSAQRDGRGLFFILIYYIYIFIELM